MAWLIITNGKFKVFLNARGKNMKFSQKINVYTLYEKGVKYEECTSMHAAAGAVWCATQTHRNLTVIEGRWGDCTDGCPGASKYN